MTHTHTYMHIAWQESMPQFMRAMLTANTECILIAVESTRQLLNNSRLQHATSFRADRKTHMQILHAHELCKFALARCAAVVLYLVAIANSDFARFMLDDMPDIRYSTRRRAV